MKNKNKYLLITIILVFTLITVMVINLNANSKEYIIGDTDSSTIQDESIADDAEKENIDSIYKRLSYDKRTLIAIDAIVYPDIITTRVSAMLDLTAAIKNYHEAYAMVLNRDNAFEIYKKNMKEN